MTPVLNAGEEGRRCNYALIRKNQKVYNSEYHYLVNQSIDRLRGK